ncbi:MAG TPA: hypothetical protein VGZ73_23740 [Bryobacteraceae bacterium]|nr:hypothetical protein [Bryobacteraceae bacterium]
MQARTRQVGRNSFSLLGLTLLLVPFGIPGFGQNPDNALQFVGNIPVPNWATSGKNEVSVDIVAFDPQSGVVYIADHVNDGALAIDTHTGTVLGVVSPPGCGITTHQCAPSGTLVAPDLRKLVMTGSKPPSLWVYDLRAPGAAPVAVSVASGPDLIDYNPINHYVYVKHSRQVSVVDLVNLTVVAQIPLTVSSQQPRFNPVDGAIYLTVTNGVLKIDPVTNTPGATYSLKTPTVTCNPNDFAIDPVTNTAFIACGGSSPAVLMDLNDGTILNTFPQITGSDSIAFDPTLRHFYSASNANTNSNGLCSSDSTKAFPSIGVVSILPTSSGRPPGKFVGVACSGRGIQVAADTINHDVYAASIQFPVDANSPDTGQPGVLVFHDQADGVTGTPQGTDAADTRAVLSPVGASGIHGSATISLRRRNQFVEGSLTGLPAASTSAELVITTTVGNEVVNCGGPGDDGSAFCQARLIGDPLIGGVVDVGVDGVFVAKGTINLVDTFPAFITATPNPIPVTGSALGMAMISWNAPTAGTIEIHVNSPSGPLFTRNGNKGSMSTGAWIADGTAFYLQDVTGGLPLTASNTIALTIVHLQR